MFSLMCNGGTCAPQPPPSRASAHVKKKAYAVKV
jgi:hypothetical protein